MISVDVFEGGGVVYIAAQIRWTLLVLGLISLGFSIDLEHIPSQVHRRGAKIAEGFLFL